MKIKYTVEGLKETDEVLNVSKDKIFRIYDHGRENIANTKLEKITKVN